MRYAGESCQVAVIRDDGSRRRAAVTQVACAQLEVNETPTGPFAVNKTNARMACDSGCPSRESRCAPVGAVQNPAPAEGQLPHRLVKSSVSRSCHGIVTRGARGLPLGSNGFRRAGAKAAQTHTGALAGADAVYDAAFHRAGLLRVLDLDELFAAAETLGRVRPFPGERLAILTNGGGVGVLAVDRLADLGGTLAGDNKEARRGAAADLVARQPGRHRRRR